MDRSRLYFHCVFVFLVSSCFSYFLRVIYFFLCPKCQLSHSSYFSLHNPFFDLQLDTRSCLTRTHTHTSRMGVSAEFAKFVVLVTLSAHYAVAQTTVSSGVVGATDAPNVTSGSTGDAWYDNAVTMAVIIILCNTAVVFIAGPLLISSYRKCQALY